MSYEVLSPDPWTIRFGRGRPWTALPISAEARITFAREAASPERAPAALYTLWRLAFPVRLSSWWAGDPVRQLLALPAAAHAEVLADFFRLEAPPPPPDPAAPADPYEALRAANSDQGGGGGGQRIPFERLARLVEREMGPRWWYDRDRWPTADGYAPVRTVWTQWSVLLAAKAWERLNIIRAVGVPRLEKQAQRLALDADLAEAFGRDHPTPTAEASI